MKNNHIKKDNIITILTLTMSKQFVRYKWETADYFILFRKF